MLDAFVEGIEARFTQDTVVLTSAIMNILRLTANYEEIDVVTKYFDVESDSLWAELLLLKAQVSTEHIKLARSVWTAALLSTVVVLCISWVVKRRHQQRLFRRYGIPGPVPSILFGNWKQLKEDRLKVMDDWIQEYGKVFGFYEGELPKVVISDLDMIKECFVKEAHMFRDRMPLIIEVEPIKSSLLALRGDEWKRVRSVLNPTFSSAKMKLMSQVMNACGNTLVEVMSERLAVGQDTIDVTKTSQALSMDVITKCALAWQVDCQRNVDDPTLRLLQRIFLEVDQRMMASAVAIPILRKIYAWIFPLITYGKMLLQIADNLRNVIAVRSAEREGKQGSSVDIIQLMLDSRIEAAHQGSDKVEITDRHLVANCFVFLAGGFETTATTLAFLLYELARHPEEQDNLYQEVKSQLTESSVHLGYDDVQKLKRMDAVISECLRLYPPIVLFTARVCARDTPIAGYTMPAGAHVILPTWHVHHNPNIWPEPHKFIPDRFLSDSGQEERRHAAAYVPFGLGPRECIGRRFALLELKTVLAKLVRTYVFSVCDDADDPIKLTVPTVTLNPVRNIKLRVTRRSS
ncbi:cytochrome P450 3A4 [Dermacentor silvarum]|uniref:cytochrome P450 3A4 n=1 Tax=Dermacentor silvarum TaxID=543639 RepID=UPI0021014DF3|nr:cytochrome P450 3A4 [Dermacentor silvarum]